MLAISVAAGIFIGNLLMRNSQPFHYPIGQSRPNKLTTILKLIESGYVDSVNSSDNIEKALHGILRTLDTQTAYIPA